MKKLIFIIATMLTMATSAFAQIGSLSSDLVFTPVTPCRILDTRNPGTKSGILVANTVRGFWGWNNGFSTQGGSATSCGTLNSTNEAAILVNFTVVTPDTGGYITAYPADVADVNKPLAATVNFTAGSVVGNNATIKLNQTGTGDDFKIFTTSNVHVVADIVGYYSKPVATALECTETAEATGLVNLGPTTYGTTQLYISGFVSAAACATGYTQVELICRATSSTVAVQAHRSSFNTCTGSTPQSGQSIYASQRCCRIPGR